MGRSLFKLAVSYFIFPEPSWLVPGMLDWSLMFLSSIDFVHPCPYYKPYKTEMHE